jgi:hypothetical protein
VFRTLGDHADSLRAAGDPRSRTQLMADTLVMRVLGVEQPTARPVTAHVVVADDVLFGHKEDAAHLDGFGPIPAELARELIKTAGQKDLARLRRLYVAPETGELVAADSRSRFFSDGLALLIDLRDQTCRTPWCDAPIRHHDHVVGVVDDGGTSLSNGQGLCEGCNYAKTSVGWAGATIPGRAAHGGDHDTERAHVPVGRPTDAWRGRPAGRPPFSGRPRGLSGGPVSRRRRPTPPRRATGGRAVRTR